MTDHEPLLHLISFDICPFVERSRIVLDEKELDYKITFIDLADKPDWFLDISPRGKVPVLLVDDEPIFESAVINEFLDEAFPEPPLFSDDVVARARARSWIVYANDVVMAAYAQLWFGGDASDEIKQSVRTAIERVERHLADRTEGPFFFGETFGLVDAVYAPIFSRRESTHRLFGPIDSDFPQWSAYGDALLERESVQVAQAQNLTEKMVAYIEKLHA